MGVEIALALGLSGAIATAAGAAINAGIGLALSLGAQRLTGRKNAAATDTGFRLSLQVDADVPRAAVLGETALAGSLVYWHLTGKNNKILSMVIALADHECDSLRGVIVNGVYRTWDSGTEVVAGTDGRLRVTWHSGAFDQVADATVVAGSGGHWTADDRGAGVCYVAAHLTYDPDTWPGGIPKLLFVVRGHNGLLDPRTDATGYTANWGVAVFNALRGIRQYEDGPRVVGLHAAVGSVDVDDAIAACAASDEDVALASGSTEPRYSVGAVLSSDMTAREVLEILLGAGGGDIVESAGLYRILPAVAQTPVAALSDDDIILDRPFGFEPRQARSELINTVEGAWLDPSKAYVRSQLPARQSAADILTDGGIRLAVDLDLTACPSRAQAQRVMEIKRRRARRQGRAGATLRPRWQTIEPGDWVSFTSSRRGWSNRVFVVASADEAPDGSIECTFVETDADVDNWTASMELSDFSATDLPSAGPTTAAITSIALSNLVVSSSGGVQRPGLRLTWDALEDPTVVSLRLEYRRISDTVALTETILDPDAGSFEWLNGVQSGATYEARIRPETLPLRAADWSPWVQAGGETALQIVAVAQTAEELPPETVTPEMLSIQAQFDLGFALQTADTAGSIAEALKNIRDDLQTLGASVLTHNIDLSSTRATVRTEQVERVELDRAFAQFQIDVNAALEDLGSASAIVDLQTQVDTIDGEVTAQASAITSLQTDVAGNTSSVTQILSDVNGDKRFAIVFDSNGHMTGTVSLDGTTTGTELTIGVDALRVYDPTVNGGVPLPLMAVATVNGQAEMVINGTLITKLIEAGTINAASGSVGTLTAGVIYGGPDGKLLIDLNNGRIRGTV